MSSLPCAGRESNGIIELASLAFSMPALERNKTCFAILQRMKAIKSLIGSTATVATELIKFLKP